MRAKQDEKSIKEEENKEKLRKRKREKYAAEKVGWKISYVYMSKNSE